MNYNNIYNKRFELILIAAKRSEDLNCGASPKITGVAFKKDSSVALKEISVGLLNIKKIKKTIVKTKLLNKFNIENQEKNKVNKTQSKNKEAFYSI